MRDEFAVDESGMTSDGYHRLLPACKKSMYVSNAITMAILIILEALGLTFLKDFLGDWYDTTLYITIALLVIVAIYMLFGPQVFYRRYRYRIDDEKDPSGSGRERTYKQDVRTGQCQHNNGRWSSSLGVSRHRDS